MRLTGRAIAEAMRARIAAGDPARVIDGFSIDTRTLAPGDLFFAIRGARLDGHSFLAGALAGGAVGVVVSDPAAIGADVDALVIVVDDTTTGLQALARTVRQDSGARVVAITGSAGKTTTKEVTAEFLSAGYRVFRNPGNLNNHIGLPLSLLELRKTPDVAVVELGMNHAGEIGRLVAIAEPDIRIWTNVGDAHIGFFESADELAAAKAEILERATSRSILIANADDERVMGHARRFAGTLVTFGFGTGADVRADQVEDLGLEGTRARVRTPVGEAQISLPLIGMGNVANVLAGLATGLQFGVSLEAMAERARSLTPVGHRGQVWRLSGGVSVIDDSYNSSPAALAGALGLLRRAGRANRMVAVLGEMLELGPHAMALHEESGRRVAGAGVGLLVAVGGAPVRALADSAMAAGMSADAVRHVSTSEQAADLVPTLLRDGDVVLVKGSRGLAMELVVDRLRKVYR